MTVPPSRNTGLSAASFADGGVRADALVRADRPSPSAAVPAGSPRRTGRPSRAAAARWWLRSANASCRSRLTP